MRTRNGKALGAAAAAVAMAACASQMGSQKPMAAAPFAGQYGESASVRAPTPGQGYSARDRHMADCLASVPGYDPATDRVAVRPGVTTPCPF